MTRAKDISKLITGTTVTDLTVGSSEPDLIIQDTDGTNQLMKIQQVGGASMIKTRSGSNDGELYITGEVTGTNKMKISTSGQAYFYGSLDVLGAFTSQGIDDNADATAITITSAELVGISETSPLGKLHIKSGDSGASSVNANANELVVENSDYTGITILGENETNIMFGDNEDPDVGRIVYFHGTNTMSFMTNTNNAMHIDSTGAVTKPLQPAFSVHKGNSAQDNISEGSDVTVTFSGEQFDQNSDFASNTFTAPVTGKYFLDASIRMSSVQAAVHYYALYIKTSNKNYGTIFDARVFDTDSAYFTMKASILADMDASDTAYVAILQEASGSETTDISGDTSWTYFTGHLVC